MNDKTLNEYTVEICVVQVIQARDSIRAVEIAMKRASIDDAYIYVDGDCVT